MSSAHQVIKKMDKLSDCKQGTIGKEQGQVVFGYCALLTAERRM
jgi:hypothetical protein